MVIPPGSRASGVTTVSPVAIPVLTSIFTAPWSEFDEMVAETCDRGLLKPTCLMRVDIMRCPKLDFSQSDRIAECVCYTL